MPGYLCHALRFRKEHYLGSDGKPHYEVMPDEGETDDVSYCNWEAMKAICENLGIPKGIWPEFSEYEETIDLPLDQVEKMNPALRDALGRLNDDEAASHYLLLRIVKYIRRGELIFFC